MPLRYQCVSMIHSRRWIDASRPSSHVATSTLSNHLWRSRTDQHPLGPRWLTWPRAPRWSHAGSSSSISIINTIALLFSGRYVARDCIALRGPVLALLAEHSLRFPHHGRVYNLASITSLSCPSGIFAFSPPFVRVVCGEITLHLLFTCAHYVHPVLSRGDSGESRNTRWNTDVKWSNTESSNCRSR